jgi:hypothetical protein
MGNVMKMRWTLLRMPLLAGVALAIAAIDPAQAVQPNSLKVVNQCTFAVWIQQQKLPGAPAIVRIASGKSYTYAIALDGPLSTRFWPKKGCDASGNNCSVGQSSPPCPSKGCAPPVDSKVEISWGCLLGSSCPPGRNNETFFNLSQVDGFTLPYSVNATGTGNNCKSASCPTMNYANGCQGPDDLSTQGNFPSFRRQSLSVVDPVTKRRIGCFSSCGKLTFAKEFGGHNLSPNSPQAAFYCCVPVNGTNPIPSLNPGTPEGCRAGPVPQTKYVQFIDSACSNDAYGYAYDDAHGLKNCIGTTDLVFTICP